MQKIVTVAVREFLETVKTKAFLLGAVIFPMFMAAMIFGTEKLARVGEKESLPTRKLAIVDYSGVIYAPLVKNIEAYNAENPNRPFAVEMVAPDQADRDQLRERVKSGDLYGYWRIPADAWKVPTSRQEPGEPCELGRKDSQLRAGRDLENMLNSAVVAVRFEKEGVDHLRIKMLEMPVAVKKVDVSTARESTGDEVVRLFTPFIFMLLLWMGTMGISNGLLTSLLEEKSSRVIEVLLSAISPMQLMAGKILGLACVGLLLLSIWGVVGYNGARQVKLEYLVTTTNLLYVLLYFVPGFLLSAAILAAVGSACNTLKDAQSMAFPVSIFMIVPMLMWFPISQNPHSALSMALSFIPPITPFIMVLRLCADPAIALWEVAATLGVLWLGVFAAIWVSAKIFRIGILMYGKPPSIKELVRWVRHT